jgi:hypothetical protein
VLSAFAAACISIVSIENILYDINMLNNSHSKTAFKVILCGGAGSWSCPEKQGGTDFSAVLNDGQDLNPLKKQESSLRSE